jgi:hypothetical protein
VNQAEVVQIVNLVAAADGRNVNEQTYAAWMLVIGHLGFNLAKEATLAALKDEAIRWTEPKHVLAKAGRVLEVREQDKRRERALTEHEVKKGTPVPICRDHGRSIMQCDVCCKKAGDLAALNGGVQSSPYQTLFWQEVCHPQ